MDEPATDPIVSSAPLADEQFGGDLGEGNFGLAVAAGLGAAVVGAIIWALIVYVTQMELGLVAIALGALVGYAVQRAGRGSDPRFGILGGACAAAGWALGTVLGDLAFLAQQTEVPLLDVIPRVGTAGSIALAFQAADGLDLLFLAIAVWEGYKFSTRQH